MVEFAESINPFQLTIHLEVRPLDSQLREDIVGSIRTDLSSEIDRWCS